MIAEKTDLAIGAIAQGVCVSRGYFQEIIVAKIHPNAVGHGFGKPRLRLSVALEAGDVEPDHHVVAVAVLVASRKIAIQTAPNLDALRHHANGFGDIQRVVCMRGDVDGIRQDAFAAAAGINLRHNVLAAGCACGRVGILSWRGLCQCWKRQQRRKA